MNLRTFLIAAFALVIFTTNSFSANAAEIVRGFLVDLARVDDLVARGAVDIKIFAAYDKENKPYYIMAGLDNRGALIPGQVYRQNETGDCPPTCDFLPSNLVNGGSFIDVPVANGLVENYLNAHSTAENAVKVCSYSLKKVKDKGYHYMRVTFEPNVKVTGVKDDGRIKWFAPFTHSCNTHSRSSLSE